MIVRHPREDELTRAGEVGCIAFGHTPLEHWIESYRMRAEAFGLDYLFVVEDEGQIVSSLLTTPGPIWCGGDVVSHAAVGAVATIPEYRRRGCAGAMMTQTVKRLRELEIHTSSLWPFSFPYYRKFGWELGCERRRYSGKPEEFARLGDPSTVRNTAPDDISALVTACERFASRYAGPTKRDERWWEGMREGGLVFDDDCLPDGRARVFRVGEDQLTGYALYRWSEQEGETAVHIDELMAEDIPSALSLLARAGQLESAQVSLLTPSDDLLLQILDDPRALKVQVEAGFQFRVIDPPAALASRTPQRGISGAVTFQLGDPVFPEGWRFTAEIENGSMNISDRETVHNFSTSVEMFARMFVSYLRPSQAVYLGRAAASSDEALSLAEAAFRPLTPFRSGMEPG